MYFAIVILLLLIFPAASVWIEAVRAPHPSGFMTQTGAENRLFVTAC
jgi:hypothetical protein